MPKPRIYANATIIKSLQAQRDQHQAKADKLIAEAKVELLAVAQCDKAIAALSEGAVQPGLRLDGVQMIDDFSAKVGSEASPLTLADIRAAEARLLGPTLIRGQEAQKPRQVRWGDLTPDEQEAVQKFAGQYPELSGWYLWNAARYFQPTLPDDVLAFFASSTMDDDLILAGVRPAKPMAQGATA